MKKVQNKIKIDLAKPWFGDAEARAAYEVIKFGWLISGPKVKEFEEKFAQKIGVRHAVAVQSGSAALLVAQQALGITKGDEVIVPNMTFVSTATSCMYLGAHPVFADIELKTYGMDAVSLEKRINKKTKAIIPVHYAGQSCDLEPILKIAKKHKLFVVEDAAEAHLAKYKGKRVGSIGDIGIFSFTPSKPMTTGEGGMITTNNKEIANKCRLIRNFHDVGKFQWEELGFHFRMPEAMGAIGLVQLAKLERAIEIRHEIADKFSRAFKKIDCIIIPFLRKKEDANFQLYTIRIKPEKLSIDRDRFIDELAERGVRSRLYYPCLHRQGVFISGRSFSDREFPNTVLFSKTALSLPIYAGLTNSEINYIIDSVSSIARKFTR